MNVSLATPPIGRRERRKRQTRERIVAAAVDPRAAALFLFDAYIGVITRWFGTAPAERFDLRAGLRQALAVALHGISRKPAT